MNPATDAPVAPHALNLWADGQKVATLGYEALTDRWSLDYDADWVAAPGAFPLSPALPFQPSADGHAVGAVKRFVENLLPEGRALDIAATTCRVSKSNIYALISALGTETTGAFRFWRSDGAPSFVAAKPPHEVTREELDQRIAERDQTPLAVWDGKVRMSIAGIQDELMVYLDRPLSDVGRLCLVEPPLASTGLLSEGAGKMPRMAPTSPPCSAFTSSTLPKPRTCPRATSTNGTWGAASTFAKSERA